MSFIEIPASMRASEIAFIIVQRMDLYWNGIKLYGLIEKKKAKIYKIDYPSDSST